MKKNILFITIAGLMIIATVMLAVFGLTQLYYYNHPEVEIHITSLKNSDIDRVTVSFNERSRFGMNPLLEARIFDCGAELRSLYEKLEIRMDEPRGLKAQISREADQTVIRFKVYGTKDGIREDIDEVIVLGVPVTDVILD